MRDITLEEFIEKTLKTIKVDTDFDISLIYLTFYDNECMNSDIFINQNPNEYSNRLRFTLSPNKD